MAASGDEARGRLPGGAWDALLLEATSGARDSGLVNETVLAQLTSGRRLLF